MSHDVQLQKPILTRILNNNNIHTILDMACGWGVWGLLLRVQNQFDGLIDGFDFYMKYIDALNNMNIYDNVFNYEILEYLNDEKYKEYDLVLCCEIIEHLSREKGLWIINRLKDAKRVIISTPYASSTNYNPIGGHWSGTDLMLHKSGYTPIDFKDYEIELIDINYIPKYFKWLFKIRERLSDKAYCEKHIIAYRGF